MNSNNSNTEFDGVRAAQSRKKGFLGLAAAIVVAGGSYALYWHFIGSRYISTDNAYAAAEIAEVTCGRGRDYRASECSGYRVRQTRRRTCTAG